jgi:beta-galactosidase
VEFRIGKARMILCSVNLVSNLDRRLQARQLRYSLLRYMRSDRFLPKGAMQLEQLTGMFREASVMTHAKIVRASSFQPGYPPQNAIDGDPETLWSTLWSPEIQRHPHEIVVDLGKEYDIRGFTCLPRQDGNPNGWIREYAFYVSRDGKQWGKAISKGEFERSNALKKVSLFNDQSVYKEPVRGRYLRLTAVSGFNDDPYSTLAELDIMAD